MDVDSEMAWIEVIGRCAEVVRWRALPSRFSLLAERRRAFDTVMNGDTNPIKTKTEAIDDVRDIVGGEDQFNLTQETSTDNASFF
jgi:hypothetical protein